MGFSNSNENTRFDAGAVISVAGKRWRIRSASAHNIPEGVRADIEVCRPRRLITPFITSLDFEERLRIEMEEFERIEFAVLLEWNGHRYTFKDHEDILRRSRLRIGRWLFENRFQVRPCTAEEPVHLYDPPRFRPPMI